MQSFDGLPKSFGDEFLGDDIKFGVLFGRPLVGGEETNLFVGECESDFHKIEPAYLNRTGAAFFYHEEISIS